METEVLLPGSLKPPVSPAVTAVFSAFFCAASILASRSCKALIWPFSSAISSAPAGAALNARAAPTAIRAAL